MSDQANVEQQLRQECWEKRFYSFGTAKIFERRALKLGRKRRLITFLGLATPITLGAFVTAYSAASPVLQYILLPLSGAVAMLQSVVSLWSLVAGWDEAYAYAIGSVKNNNRLTSLAEELARGSRSRLEKDIELLRFEYSRQDAEDSAQEITDKEKRYAERCALFQYRQECPACKQVPANMKPTSCDSCGNF